MTDDNVKEAAERLRAYAYGPFSDQRRADELTLLADYDALQAEMDKLSGENAALEKGAPEFWLARIAKGNELLNAAEAKLTALVEAAKLSLPILEYEIEVMISSYATPSNPTVEGMSDRKAYDHTNEMIAARDAIVQALAHHSAPVEPRPGEIRVIGGIRQRFIEHGDVGQVWEPLSDAPSTTPTSAPVEDVGGLVTTLVLQAVNTALAGVKAPGRAEACDVKYYVDRILAALSPSLIQPQGEERSTDADVDGWCSPDE